MITQYQIHLSKPGTNETASAALPMLPHHHCDYTATLPPHHYYHRSIANIIARFTTSDQLSDLNACRCLAVGFGRWPMALFVG
jgi:hypothetical protein